MTDGINLRQAKRGDSLIKLIGEKLKSENGGKEVRLNGSVWNQILDVVDEQQKESGNVYKGGSERKNWGRNYVIVVGQVITFSKEFWTKIKELAGIVSSDVSDNKQVSCQDRTVEEENVAKPKQENEVVKRNLPYGISEVETFRTEEEQVTYKKVIENAKNILINNAVTLGLSEDEIELINNIKIESINFGSARYARETNEILFNINDNLIPPGEGIFCKIILHELTHASKGEKIGSNSKSEERMCETRAIKLALQLINEGKLSNFQIPQGKDITNPNLIYITLLSSEDKISNFVEAWLKDWYADYPEDPVIPEKK